MLCSARSWTVAPLWNQYFLHSLSVLTTAHAIAPVRMEFLVLHMKRALLKVCSMANFGCMVAVPLCVFICQQDIARTQTFSTFNAARPSGSKVAHATSI